MYTITIGGRPHRYPQPIVRAQEAVDVARELSRDFPGTAVHIVAPKWGPRAIATYLHGRRIV